MDEVLEEFNILLGKYKNLFFLMPFIGGLAQIFELSLISPAYLRFFSPTQLIADTLLVLFLTFLILPIGLSTSKFLSKKSKWSYVEIFINIILAFCFLCLMIKALNHVNLEVFVPLIIIPVVWLFKGFKELFIRLGKTQVLKHASFPKISGERKDCFLMTVIILFFYGCLIFLHSVYFVPESFVNKNQVCESLLEKDVCEILYFNDKYIFVEIGFEKIQILPFEAFFERN